MNYFKVTRATRHLALILLAGFVLVSCGGGGGSGTQTTTTQAGIVVTKIIDPTVPVIAVAADRNWKERISLVGNKDAAGNPLNLTEIHYSTLGSDIKIEFSVDGLPSVMSDMAGNKVVFTNLTASTVDVTFFDQVGGTIAGPTTIQINSAKFAALKNMQTTAAGLQQGISRDVYNIYLSAASDVAGEVLCGAGLVADVVSWGAATPLSLLLTGAACASTANLIIGLNNQATKTADNTISLGTVLNDTGLVKTMDWIGLAVTSAIDVATGIVDNYPPAKPIWFGPGIVAHHDHIELIWGGSEGDSAVKEYFITRDDNKTFQTTLGIYPDYNVTPGSQYCYRVQAHAPNINLQWSAISDPVCATVPSLAPPLVVTGAVTNITPSSVTLNGSVNPNAAVTNAHFEYGTSTSYGNQTPLVAAGNGTSFISLTENLSNLVTNTTYHYRVVAINSEGNITYSSDQTFQSVVPVTAAPTITNVSPATVTGSNSAQPFTINGSNFVAGAHITLRDKSTGEIFPNRQPTSFTNTSITLSTIFTTAADTWSVNVVNPDNSSTGEYVFSVVAPTGVSPLSFTSLSPSLVAANTAGYQPALTASGSNFNYVKQISFSWSGVTSGNSTWLNGDINWLRKVIVNSDGSMTLKPVVTSTGDPAGTTNWTVTLTDFVGATATKTFTVNYTPTTTITCTPPQVLTNGVCGTPSVTSALSITTTAFNPSTATVGVGYGAMAAIAATGGTTPYSCSASGLPSGMAMNSSTCAIYGTPTVSGTFNVTVTVTDSSSTPLTASKVLPLTVSNPAVATPILSSISPSTITQGTSYQNVTFSGSGFTASSWTQYSVSGGSTWAWATSAPTYNSPTSMTVGVNNTVAQTIYWRVCASNGSTSCSGFQTVTVQAAAVSIPATPTGTATSGVIGTSSGPGPVTPSSTVNMSWNTSSGTGVDYNLIVTDVTSNTQALNIRLPGNTYTTALTAGHQYSWKVAACNTTGCSPYTAAQYFQTPGSTPALSITTTSLPSATVGTGYAQGVAVSGGQTPYTWYVSSGLPGGLYINSTTGAIYGTPSVSGTFYFTVTAYDSSSPQKTASQALSLSVGSAVVVLSVNGVASSYIGTGQKTIPLTGSGFNSLSQISWSCTMPNGATPCTGSPYVWTPGTAKWSNVTISSDTVATVYPTFLIASDPPGTYSWSVTFSGGGQSVIKYFTAIK